uniref:Kin of IRRE-like protein 1 n=1 Tax=Phallusia mammillata TaxID=59560 RepID=A0A6F9DFB2_9ASCI|nr:kin of IRRE-like protein 1 [Phallusia mammillata]
MEPRLWLGLVTCYFIVGHCFAADPTIIEEPNDVTVKQGDDVTMRCVVEHLPSDDLSPVQWTRGDFALGFDRNLSNWERYSMVGDISIGEYNLHINNVNLQEDESQYECQVTMYYMRTRKATLTVQVPPSGPFIDHMSDDGITVNAVADQENTFTCRAYGGKPAAKLTWYKDGTEITENVENVFTGPIKKLYNTTAILRITPSADDVDATYACVMKSDVMDEMKSIMMKLNIQKPPIVSVSLPPSIGVGDYVRAECRAVADPPVTSYRWFVNDVVQSDELSPTFDISDVDRSWHHVTLGCQARNEAGFSKVSQVQVDVKYPPVFVSGSPDQTAEIDDNVTLSCEWDSNPQSLVRWVKVGSDEIYGTGSSLFLTRVKQEDAGTYKCKATADGIGENHATIKLHVRGPPVFSSPSTQQATVGEDSAISCELSSVPGIQEVTWTWTHGDTTFTLRGNDTLTSSGDVIEQEGDVKYRGLFSAGGKSASLHVFGTNQADFHTYSCEVANSYGTNSMEIVLEEGSAESGEVLMLGAGIAAAVGGILLLVIIAIVCVHCVKSRRQRKSTTFDQEGAKNSKQQSRMYSDEEMVPINHEEFNVRSSRSSQVGGGESSVDGSDDTNPTPTSGQDDGYHTEEAHSWSRTDQPGKGSSSSTSPTKSSSLTNGYHPGYSMHPHQEEEPMFVESNYPPTSYNDQYHTMSPTRYGYDPTALVNPSSIRSASALGDRLSPPPVRYVQQRKVSDVSAPASGAYAIQSLDFYPPRSFTPMQTYSDPHSGFGPSPNYGGNRTTPLPSTITGNEPFYQHPGAGGSSQSSLDRIERGSALSASAVASRAIDPYENSARMSNLSSRLSQSSRSSDFLRPLQARMATHV